ncbi:hypothetical protein V8C86DRAFT_2548065 [Haematococcus lacustris]
MRLQLTAEEIEAGLQDSSAQAMRRIPFAVQEIYRLQVRAGNEAGHAWMQSRGSAMAKTRMKALTPPAMLTTSTKY